MMALDCDKLAKVLALLSSPMDSEVLAAARMAVKLLAANGQRPEDLAKGVLVVAQSTPTRPPRPAWTSPKEYPFKAKDYGPTPKPKRRSFADLKPTEARRVLAYMLACGRLSPKDAAFVREIAERMYERPHEGLYSDEKSRLTWLWNKVAPEKKAAA